MTGQDVYNAALSFCNQTDNLKSDNTANAVNWINQLLQESFEANNCLRRSAGRVVLDAPQTIATLSDTLTYEDMITKRCLVDGVASFIHKVLKDYSAEQDFRARFVVGLQELSPAQFEPIVDVYAEAESEE